MSKYFTIGTPEWQKTAKFCLLTGFIIGLILGAIILCKILPIN